MNDRVNDMGCNLDPLLVYDMAIGSGDVAIGFGLGYWRYQLRHF